MGPDFLGIGAARSGTTWLSALLTRHPDVWLPVRKELHWFSAPDHYPSPSHLQPRPLAARLFGGSKAARDWREVAWRTCKSVAKHRSAAHLRWELRYLFRTPNDAWYQGLFPARDGLTTGEITPAYALLDSADVARVKALLPDLRLLYMMRNPVDRDWSTLRYHHSRGAIDLASCSPGQVAQLLDQPGLVARSDYLGTLDTWQGVFGQDRVLALYYDDISTRPAELAAQVAEFLGLAPFAPAVLENLAARGRINASGEQTMPAAVRAQLQARHLAMVTALAERCGGAAQQWLEGLAEGTDA